MNRRTKTERVEMMRLSLFLMVLACFIGCQDGTVVGPAVTKEQDSAEPGFYDTRMMEASSVEREVLKKLQKKIPVSIVDVPFSDAVEYIRTTSGVSIYVGWGAIEAELPDIKTKEISVHLDNVSVEKALDFILEDAGGGIVKLGYVIDGGVIRITTATVLQSEVYPVVYNVSDLVFVPRNLSYSSEVQPPDRLHANPYDFQGEEPPMSEDERIDQLRDLIQSNAGGEMAWTSGGGQGQITYIDDLFVISQTADNHREVSRVLTKLRENLYAASIHRIMTIQAWWVRSDAGLAGEKGGPAILTDRQLEKMNVVHHGRISCFNRQWVSLSSGGGEIVVTGTEPEVGHSVKGDRPIVRMIHWGPILDIHTRIGIRGRTATVRVRTVISAPGPEAVSNGDIDKLKFRISTLRTDIKVPLGKAILVGGLVSTQEKKDDQVFLVLKIDAEAR